MRTLNLLLILVISFSFCHGARILGIIPTPSYSHQVVFQPIWRELSLRGHQVTVLTTNPIKDPALTNLTEIDLSISYKYIEAVIEKLKTSLFGGVLDFQKGMMEITEVQVQHPQVQEIIKGKTKPFDVIMLEYIYPTWFGLGKKLGCPVIGLSSLDAPDFAYNLMGTVVHPVLYPEPMVPYAGKLSFHERFISTVYGILSPFIWNYHIPEMEKAAKKLFEMEELDLQKAYYNIEVFLTNRNPFLSPVRPLTPTIIEIGGGLHLNKPKALPQELQTFLDSANEGFIYFSLGSNVKSKDLSKPLMTTILGTYSQLPFKILWKYEAEHLKQKPDNVKISKWVPQQDVLRHKNIKLFISQCGLQSTEEALYSHIPMICIPWIGDQQYNSRIVSSRGIGLTLDYSTLTETNFNSTIYEVITNSKYRNRVEELAKFAVDQPMTGLQKAVWWTEYVIRHKSAQQLKNPEFNIPFYQYYLLDVALFSLILVITLLFTIRTLFKCFLGLLRFLFGGSKRKTE